MTETYIANGLEYTLSNYRMRYNPDIHENHREPFSEEELAYICSIWDINKKDSIAMVLGRTHGTVLKKVNDLRESQQFEYYKRLGLNLYHNHVI
ncbi:DNA-entry nuclease [Psychrobacillus sp. FSL K6-2684]|uniref:DNA-entry nuclease n=1 Tax=unclassified Psychrobacillus TaxID=2636677 RepID=UPI0030F8C4FE